MNRFLCIGVLWVICGCSTPDKASRAPVSFAEFERIKPGVSERAQVLAWVGDADLTRKMSEHEEAWIYRELDGARSVQRFSFVIDRRCDCVTGSSWVPRSNDALHDFQLAKSHFAESKFSMKDTGWVGGHAYSDQASYADSQRGISILVRKTPGDVLAISFTEPKGSVAKRD